MTKIDNVHSKELVEIQKLLEKAEKSRFATGLTPDQKLELEKASMVLRKREKELITLINKEIAEDIKKEGAQLKNLSKEMREKSTKMGKNTKNATQVKKAIQLINHLISSLELD